MATYAIGDVQGCFGPLMQLIKVIDFNPAQDQLMFCGDLVNRGGRSLDVLRWIYAHQHCCNSVLGNHDLNMLSKYYGSYKSTKNQEFKQVFAASDAPLLLNWLLNRPLYIQCGKDLIIHAGLYPNWKVKQFKQLAQQTQQALLTDPKQFFKIMYGNTPTKWSTDLDQESKIRFVVNASTRMRFVRTNGSLNFSANGRQTKIKNLKPWFSYKPIKKLKKHIIFGHWSALGLYQDSYVTGLDAGKVWGGQLTALRLEDRQLFSV
ncbi:Bis(5'-nucleosyl)-tetraphosphatase, symmetrical [hydrothermal vent metagenome]|uniref:bis(5'-nucleosyl)-tetraphosphatase (symmetrical) n=1 Tax=hydrothermal vent metagenome TaxID=652676 RepID=A0A3B0VY15_9ZZZZ